MKIPYYGLGVKVIKPLNVKILTGLFLEAIEIFSCFFIIPHLK
jgi:hypothetical protein